MHLKGTLVEEDAIDVVLAGNPNVGKTAVFNALTGLHQKTGNWPGVTIEKKEGVFSCGSTKARVVDLPGIYGLNAFSLDERISRDYLVSSRPDLVLSIIDSTNLQRNLYLTLEHIEMGVNVVVVLNMQDELEAQGISIDTEGMTRTLGSPVLLISALKRTGIQELKSEIIKNGKEGLPKIDRKSHDQRIEEALRKIESLISLPKMGEKLNARWLSIKLIERDAEYRLILEKASAGIKSAVDQIISDLEKSVGDASVAIAQERYRSIQEIDANFVKKKHWKNRLNR